MAAVAWMRAQDKPALSPAPAGARPVIRCRGGLRTPVWHRGRVIDVRRAEQRYPGGEPDSGIESRHAFSFGAHYDPGNLGFGLLTACNEESLAPGAGFAEHTHREVEIVTWVVEGELEHRDDAGHTAIVRPGRTQWLSAGSGVRHSERNASGERPCRFVQMWLRPERFGGEPAYGITGDSVLRPPGQPAATLRIGRADLRLPAEPFSYLHVVRGEVRLAAELLGPGDAARITGGPALTAEAGEAAEYLVWQMRGEPRHP